MDITREEIMTSIYICGDSTAASYSPERAPLTGWGQVFGSLFSDKVNISNEARGGRSAKSFISENRLTAVEEKLKPGDYVFIQFAHNDGSDLVWRHTEPWTSYRNALRLFVETARCAGAYPVLLTPICRCAWDEGTGELREAHGDFPEAARQVALEMNVPMIDIYEKSKKLVRALGAEESKGLFMYFEPGIYPTYPDGSKDLTHTCQKGAEAFAGMVAEGIRELGLEIGRYLKEKG
jgi:lysophospholipase L1-like esterase